MSYRQALRERSQYLTFALIGTLLILTTLSPPPAMAADPSCAAAETLLPGSVLRRHHAMPLAEPEVVRVPVYEPGVLELYVSGDTRSVAPRVSFLGTGCTSAADVDAPWVLLRETPREIHVLIREPGDFIAAVLSQDPRVALTDYALHATFVAERPMPDDFAKDVDPWYDDGISGLTAKPGGIVLETSDTVPGASHRDGDGAVGSRVGVRHFALCADATDDHSDRPSCSTALSPGEDVTSVVDSSEDEDHFTFTLDSQQTVIIDLAGGDGIRGVLYDEVGQRLDTWDAGYLSRTLGPGRFYVQVVGVDGWIGEYGVRMETMP